jgi:hypothetical protein
LQIKNSADLFRTPAVASRPFDMTHASGVATSRPHLSLGRQAYL